jgi:hypothetical protein
MIFIIMFVDFVVCFIRNAFHQNDNKLIFVIASTLFIDECVS